MSLLGHVRGVRSEWRLCEEVHLNLACRRSCGLDPKDRAPDRSTVSTNGRSRFRDGDPLRIVFEDVVVRCVREGVLGGERKFNHRVVRNPRPEPAV